MLIRIPGFDGFACKCDVCGHEWMARLVPDRCSACKTRRWLHGGASVPVTERKKEAPPASLAAITSTARPDHDPKTCRVYRCQKCAAVDHHDPTRGL